MNKLALVIMVVGIIFTVGSFWQYRVTYPDFDKFVAYCGIGALTFIIGVLINSNSKRYNEHQELSDKFDYFEEKVMEMQDKKLKGSKNGR